WGCLMGLEQYLREREKKRPIPEAPGPGLLAIRRRKRAATGAASNSRESGFMGPRLDASHRPGNGWSVLDVGAGSGVLAIAAAKCGAEALAIEIDPRAAAIAEINARQNKVANRVRVIAGDGARHIARRQFDLVFANILMRPLIKLAPKLAPAVAPGGALILSGLLRAQAPLVREAYASRGLVLERQIPKEAWMTLVWRKPQA